MIGFGERARGRALRHIDLGRDPPEADLSLNTKSWIGNDGWPPKMVGCRINVTIS